MPNFTPYELDFLSNYVLQELGKMAIEGQTVGNSVKMSNLAGAYKALNANDIDTITLEAVQDAAQVESDHRGFNFHFNREKALIIKVSLDRKDKIQAIKDIRNWLGCELMTAKHIVEAVQAVVGYKA